MEDPKIKLKKNRNKNTLKKCSLTAILSLYNKTFIMHETIN